MIKAGDFRTNRLLMNDVVVVQKRWEVWIIPALCNESRMPTRHGWWPAVVIDANLFNGTFFSTKKFLTAVYMSTLCVVAFGGRSVSSSFFVEKSSNTIQMNIIS